MVTFRILTEIENTEVIAIRHSIRDLRYLRRRYGGQRWRKLKGFAIVERADGAIYRVELHWLRGARRRAPGF